MAVPYSRFLLGRIPWYSVLILAGFVLAIMLARREERKAGLPSDTIIDLALWVLPFGILGARLYYVIFSWDTYQCDPLSILFIWEGGLAIYGGLIAGFAVVFLFCRKRQLSPWLILDLLVPGIALAQCIGRWGNYFNMEAYGWPISNPQFQFFPVGVLVNGTWYMATFFYESIWDLFVFVFLCMGRKKLFQKSGDRFLFYLLLYASGRLIIEEFRMDSLYVGHSVRVSQLLSILAGLIVFALFFRRLCDQRKQRMYHWVILSLVMFSGFLSVLYCLGYTPLTSAPAAFRVWFLGLFSLLLICSSLLIYRRRK